MKPNRLSTKKRTLRFAVILSALILAGCASTQSTTSSTSASSASSTVSPVSTSEESGAGETDSTGGALNGTDGYVPLLEYTLSPMKRVFILKGSPGSGKSTVMKRIAARAEAEGHPLTVIRCSSDPDSLDGVMLTDLGVAVADGTSPHSLDP